jgi:hypothetical protein
MTALPPPLAQLLNELGADPWLGDIADQFRIALEALEGECADNWHAAQLMSALALVSEQRRPLRDRFIDISEIIEARGKVTVTVKRM